MSKGNTLLEAGITIAPLLGLLGTVTGLIITFNNINIGGGGNNVDLSRAAVGIAEALITTVGGSNDRHDHCCLPTANFFKIATTTG